MFEIHSSTIRQLVFYGNEFRKNFFGENKVARTSCFFFGKVLLVVLLVDRDFPSFSVIFVSFSEGIKNPGSLDFLSFREVWVVRFELTTS